MVFALGLPFVCSHASFPFVLLHENTTASLMPASSVALGLPTWWWQR
jgi:hypothetical protein